MKPPRTPMTSPGGEIGRRVFSPQTAHALPDEKEPEEKARYVARVMWNESGSEVPLGSALQFVTTATRDRAFTTTAVQGDERICGIALQNIPANAEGLVAVQGIVPRVRVAAGTTVNQFLRQSTVAGILEGVADPASGTELFALTTRDADGYCEALWMHAHAGDRVYDTTAPVLSVPIVNGTSLRVLYDETLDSAATPATTTYSIVVNGAAGVNPSAVSVNGNVVTLTITAVQPGDVVTVAYTQGATLLRDLSGNSAAAFTAQTCLNNTPDTRAPIRSTLQVNGTQLLVFYDESLDTGSTPATADYAVVKNGSGATVSSVSVAGNIVTLTLAVAARQTDIFTLAYTAGTNKVRDLARNNAANFTATAITNTTTEVVISKPVVETVTSSTTLQDDNHLTVTLPHPNPGVESAYRFAAAIQYKAVSGADIKWNFDLAGSGWGVEFTGAWVTLGDTIPTSQLTYTAGQTIESQGLGITTKLWLVLTGWVQVPSGAAASAIIKFQWAQRVSNGTGSIVEYASWVEFTESV